MLLEVNSETDFVARSDEFKDLAADLAMQVLGGKGCGGGVGVMVPPCHAWWFEERQRSEVGTLLSND